jgi:hypothetical protein
MPGVFSNKKATPLGWLCFARKSEHHLNAPLSWLGQAQIVNMTSKTGYDS